MLSKILPILAMLGLGTLARAQSANENACRSAQSIYAAYSCDRGTVTGLPNDVIVFRNRYGVEITSLTHTVNYWLNHRNSLAILGIDPGSGGQYSIRFIYAVLLVSQPLLAGGTVEIIRNGVVIDRDRLWEC